MHENRALYYVLYSTVSRNWLKIKFNFLSFIYTLAYFFYTKNRHCLTQGWKLERKDPILDTDVAIRTLVLFES